MSSNTAQAHIHFLLGDLARNARLLEHRYSYPGEFEFEFASERERSDVDLSSENERRPGLRDLVQRVKKTKAEIGGESNDGPA